jgi:peptide/nickel transport system permease protein
MLADGKSYLNVGWWLSTFPGLAIAFLVIGINLLGDAVRDLLDPRLDI